MPPIGYHLADRPQPRFGGRRVDLVEDGRSAQVLRERVGLADQRPVELQQLVEAHPAHAGRPRTVTATSSIERISRSARRTGSMTSAGGNG
jgi:hypothetical protein